MKQGLAEEHWQNSAGNPMGGVTQAVGLLISWQNGPLGHGEALRVPSGTFVETVIAAAIGRLRFYQSTKLACPENAAAIGCLEDALAVLEERTERRKAAGIEGTHEADCLARAEG